MINLLQTHVQTSVAMICGEQTLTYQDLIKVVEERAQTFIKEGLERGSRVGLIMQQDVETIISLLALFDCQAEVVCLSPKMPKKEKEKQLSFCRCQYISAPSSSIKTNSLSSVIPAKAGIQHGLMDSRLRGNDKTEGFTHTEASTFIQTSGSTGQPKWACLPVACHLASAEVTSQLAELNDKSRWYLNLPLYHVSGLSILFRCFLSGACVVLPVGKPDVNSDLKSYQITHLSVVEAQLPSLFDLEQHYLLYILVGGGPVRDRYIELAKEKGLSIHITYGMTECASQIATDGEVLAHIQLQEGSPIAIKSPALFKGYLTQDNTFHLPLNKDGYFNTGDLGHFDNTGKLVITGRQDSMFVSGGENIYPEEIEAALLKHPNISRCVVVPKPDDTFGLCPVVFIESGTHVSLDMVKQFLSDSLPKYKHPKALFLLSDVIPTGFHKLSRSYLKNWLK